MKNYSLRLPVLEVANDDDDDDSHNDEGDDNLDDDEDDSEIHDEEEPVSGKYDKEDLGNYNIIRKTLLPQNIIHIVIYIIVIISLLYMNAYLFAFHSMYIN